MTTSTDSSTPRLLPAYGSAERPARVVRMADEAVNVSMADGMHLDWPELVLLACDEMEARCTRYADHARARSRQARPVARSPNPSARHRGSTSGGRSPASARHIAANAERGARGTERDTPSQERSTAGRGQANASIAEAAELLGCLVDRCSSFSMVDEYCRAAYPHRWNAALRQCAADPSAAGTPDPGLFDLDVSLASVRAKHRRPAGMREATEAVKRLAQSVGAASSVGLGLPHAAPGPVVWPPPKPSPALAAARQALHDTIAATSIGIDHHVESLHICRVLQREPGAEGVTAAQHEQLVAEVNDWMTRVFPVGIRLACAVYAHALEWVSSNMSLWHPQAFTYAYVEAYLSVQHLRQATDVCDMTSSACRSYIWWWCQDRQVSMPHLRHLATTA